MFLTGFISAFRGFDLDVDDDEVGTAIIGLFTLTKFWDMST